MKCPKHNIEYAEDQGALRCPSQGCTHFIDLPIKAPAVPVATDPVVTEPAERREDGRAERDEAFQVEQHQEPEQKAKKKKGK
jgi:hypothetical protein